MLQLGGQSRWLYCHFLLLMNFSELLSFAALEATQNIPTYRQLIPFFSFPLLFFFIIVFFCCALFLTIKEIITRNHPWGSWCRASSMPLDPAHTPPCWPSVHQHTTPTKEWMRKPPAPKLDLFGTKRRRQNWLETYGDEAAEEETVDEVNKNVAGVLRVALDAHHMIPIAKHLDPRFVRPCYHLCFCRQFLQLFKFPKFKVYPHISLIQKKKNNVVPSI